MEYLRRYLPPREAGRLLTIIWWVLLRSWPRDSVYSNWRRNDSLSKIWMIKQYQAAYLMLHIEPDSRGEEESSHLPGSLSGIVTFLKYSTRNLSENPICCSNISPHQILCQLSLFARPNLFYFPGSGQVSSKAPGANFTTVVPISKKHRIHLPIELGEIIIL